ncbi:MAG: response regulator [Pseudomonadales bacterium]|nr:response regulator [Pseudomonadales bacterium]
MAAHTLKHVLLVEDNPADVQLMLEAANQADTQVNVQTVGDGKAALQFLRRERGFEDSVRPDLIMLDINLPQKGGLEVLEEIRVAPELKSLPVIILTTSNNPSDIAKAYSLQANCYVQKPSNLYDFEQAISLTLSFWLRLARLPAAS